MHYFVEPEVAGGWGVNTEADTSRHPPLVSKLHYQFDGWQGDDLLESFPCFIVSESLMNELISSSVTGFEIDDVEISKSDEFFATTDLTDLPQFFWLKVVGGEPSADIRLSSDCRLLVSDRALNVFRKCNISHADITPSN
jgi:hypothetical protein